MQFCYYSNDNQERGYITVDTDFLNLYISECTGDQLKVYLFGLYLCSKPLSQDNSLSHMMYALNLTEDQIKEAFAYWESNNLVEISSYDPLQIQYKSAKNASSSKLYDKEKYEDFNYEINKLFPEKASNMSMYHKYYDFIEFNHVDPMVIAAIAGYCVNIKDKNVSQSYILTVASSWIKDGVRTREEVISRIDQQSKDFSSVREIAGAIGKTSSITEEDRDFYTKWTNTWGFTKEAIICACKKSMKNMTQLDNVLDECFRNNATSPLEVEEYLKNKSKYTKYAFDLCKQLGQYYANANPIVEEYITPWINKGYDIDGLKIISNYCFKNSLKEFKQMDNIINNLYKEGIILTSSIKAYYENIQKEDLDIKSILEMLGTSREVRMQDRDAFNIWTKTWGFSLEYIKKVASLSFGKGMPDIAKKLSVLKENNIVDINSIETFLSKTNSTSNKKENKKMSLDSYSQTTLTPDEIKNIEV